MSQYGVKIMSIQAGSLYEVNLGVRKRLDEKPIMMTNSLFMDFLLNNGLRVRNGATRDIIDMDFDYGSRSYEEDRAHIQKLIKETPEKDTDRLEHLQEILERCDANKEKYDKKSKKEIREIFYTAGGGVPVSYNIYSSGGDVIGTETIRYKRLFRSAGKAKRGHCIFINEMLYKRAHRFLYMGIRLPKRNAMIVEAEAYCSLIASGICDRIRIRPENILVIPDVDSKYKTDVISIEINDKNECIAVHKNDYTVKNTLFDGQALIDSSIFPKWANGYILLRQHFFKAAAFCTHLQKFFREHYGDGYDSATVNDYWGKPHRVKDIKLVTTENACKWMKFDVSFDYWGEKIKQSGCLFGIVKSGHESKFVDVQRMSYQMVNTLDINTMDSVVKASSDYLDEMQADNDVFMQYLKINSNFSNDYDALVALVDNNPDFIYTDYFRRRKSAIINGFKTLMKSGRVIQNAENLTIIGSPYAMLLAIVGGNPEDDPTFEHEDDAIQCWTERFRDGEYLAAFRSPMNSRNNVDYLHNHYHEYFDKYFKFGKQIIAVNMVHSEFQDRSNGRTITAWLNRNVLQK